MFWPKTPPPAKKIDPKIQLVADLNTATSQLTAAIARAKELGLIAEISIVNGKLEISIQQVVFSKSMQVNTQKTTKNDK